ncbi:MAG: RluA family pseudouridine synthase [Treponema sp.]|jgi:RluA family pseudouridine synthase|nr:RluA family pseudouridine synthase [Treponema sp.]
MRKKEIFTVIYEDKHYLVVNKMSGICVGADRYDQYTERLDRLLYDRYGDIWIVHRIDRDTSGIVLYARDAETHRRLCIAFEQGTIKKTYSAIIQGCPPWKSIECNLPLIPDGDKQHRTIVDCYRGKKSSTFVYICGTAIPFSVAEIHPRTGRTHQIRVHLAQLGYPIVCDLLYSSGKPLFLSSFKRNWHGNRFEEQPLIARLGLHATTLEVDNKTFKAPFPQDFKATIKQMEKVSHSQYFSTNLYDIPMF